LVPIENIRQTGSSLTIEPLGAKTGSSTITVTVTELGPPTGAGLSAAETFVLTVVEPEGSMTFADTGAIVINDNAPATPYPATIGVAGLRGKITDVKVGLSRFGHKFPDDVGVLLVSPGGQSVVLMNRAGGGAPVNDIRINFDDASPASLPDNSLIAEGTYRPSSYGSAPTFFAPAPQNGYGTALSVFDGTDPNGTWTLYVQDNQASQAGQIFGGWLLEITTDAPPNEPPVISAIADVSTPANFAVKVDFTAEDAETPANLLNVQVTAADTNLVSITATGVGTNWTAVITPLGPVGNTDVTVTVADGTDTSTETFIVTVLAADLPPVISDIGPQTTASDTALVVAFTINDPDTQPAGVTANVVVANPVIGTATLAGAGTAWELTFTPAGALGTTEITVTATDGRSVTTETFTVTVVAPPPPVFTSIMLIQGTPLKVRFEWTGGGTLQTANSVSGPWTDQPGVVSPVEIPVDPAIGAAFARIKR
jgi:subtilisin-like proprotein convertase family protein